MTTNTKKRGAFVRFIRDNILVKNAPDGCLRLDTTRIGNILGLVGVIIVFMWAMSQENIDFEVLVKQLAGPGFLMAMYQTKKFSKDSGG